MNNSVEGHFWVSAFGTILVCELCSILSMTLTWTNLKGINFSILYKSIILYSYYWKYFIILPLVSMQKRFQIQSESPTKSNTIPTRATYLQPICIYNFFLLPLLSRPRNILMYAELYSSIVWTHYVFNHLHSCFLIN